jgi:hypothetical protein
MHGGCGIRDMTDTNRALLVKWMWQWVIERNAWWKEATPVLAPHIRPWEQPHPSTFWKNIKQLQHIFSAVSRFTMGKEDTVQFWHDNWSLGMLKYEYPKTYAMALRPHDSVVAHLVDGQWTIQLTGIAFGQALQELQQLSGSG